MESPRYYLVLAFKPQSDPQHKFIVSTVTTCALKSSKKTLPHSSIGETQHKAPLYKIHAAKNIGFKLICFTLSILYSPDLAASDFHLFPSLPNALNVKKTFLRKIRRKYWWTRNQLNFIWEESTSSLINVSK